MPLVDQVLVTTGFGIILTLIGLITVDGLKNKKEKNKRISTVNKEWQKIKVAAR